MHVEAINLPDRIAVLDTGDVVPITNLFDCLNDETDDPAEAVTFVAGAGRQWFAGRCDAFVPAPVH